MAGISDFHSNPDADRAQRLNAVLSSKGGGGAAAPFLALAAGRASSRGNERAAQLKSAQAGVKMVMDMVKSGNSLGATKILNRLVAKHPKILSEWKGIEFTTPLTKNGVIGINGKLVVLSGLKEMSQPGVTPEQKDKMMKRFVFDIGGAKGKSPYSKIDQSKLTPESRVAFDKSRNVRDLTYLPKQGGSGSGHSGFNSSLTQFNGLQKQKANLMKGMDAFGNPISKDQVKQSLDVLDPQIQNIERYMRATYPEDSKSYFPAPETQGAPPVAPPNAPEVVTGVRVKAPEGGFPTKQEDSKSLIDRLVKGIKRLSYDGGGADTSAAPVRDVKGSPYYSLQSYSDGKGTGGYSPAPAEPGIPPGASPAPQGAGVSQLYTPTDTYKSVNIPTPGNNPAYDRSIRRYNPATGQLE